VVSDSTANTGISQNFLYRHVQVTAGGPSLALTRGTSPSNSINWGLHVVRPAAGFTWDWAGFQVSVKTEAANTTAHTHPSMTANTIDNIVGHYIGFAGNGGGSALVAATDPATTSGTASTANTVDFTPGKWDRRGNQGQGTGLMGGMTMGMGLKSAGAGATGVMSSTQTLSRRHASIAFLLGQIALSSTVDGDMTDPTLSSESLAPNRVRASADLSDTSPSTESLAGGRITFGDLADTALSTESFAGVSVTDGALTDASASSESLTGNARYVAALTDGSLSDENLSGTLVTPGPTLTDASLSSESLAAVRSAGGVLTDNGASTESFVGVSVHPATLSDLAQSGESLTASTNQPPFSDTAQSGESLVGVAVRRGTLTDSALSSEQFRVLTYLDGVFSDTALSSEEIDGPAHWEPIPPTSEVWTDIPATTEIWSPL
jgi:hypothetical protein